LKSLSDSTGEEMVSVFVPSTPTAFSGYLVVVPRHMLVELPLKVEDAMRLLVSGGVLGPNDSPKSRYLANPPVAVPIPEAVTPAPGCEDVSDGPSAVQPVAPQNVG
jgi:uncharacterized membrane protein